MELVGVMVDILSFLVGMILLYVDDDFDEVL